MYTPVAAGDYIERWKLLDLSIQNIMKYSLAAKNAIGGHRMALACRELRYACEDKDKDRCLAAFVKTGDEYQILKEKFNIILQMERAMIYGKSKTGRQ
ncbi:hypothetical protein OIU85_028405 [Salix viminalis]|uniref:Uncharacterized protein n=1 Tax=Salix viminalis TaxID=40686 RepID=A0A9Q0TC09_SALVM|nr:hypothetical protein OIU85_028405 [Salix viminalis]